MVSTRSASDGASTGTTAASATLHSYDNSGGILTIVDKESRSAAMTTGAYKASSRGGSTQTFSNQILVSSVASSSTNYMESGTSTTSATSTSTLHKNDQSGPLTNTLDSIEISTSNGSGAYSVRKRATSNDKNGSHQESIQQDNVSTQYTDTANWLQSKSVTKGTDHPSTGIDRTVDSSDEYFSLRTGHATGYSESHSVSNNVNGFVTSLVTEAERQFNSGDDIWSRTIDATTDTTDNSQEYLEVTKHNKTHEDSNGWGVFSSSYLFDKVLSDGTNWWSLTKNTDFSTSESFSHRDIETKTHEVDTREEYIRRVTDATSHIIENGISDELLNVLSLDGRALDGTVSNYSLREESANSYGDSDITIHQETKTHKDQITEVTDGSIRTVADAKSTADRHTQGYYIESAFDSQESRDGATATSSDYTRTEHGDTLEDKVVKHTVGSTIESTKNKYKNTQFTSHSEDIVETGTEENRVTYYDASQETHSTTASDGSGTSTSKSSYSETGEKTSKSITTDKGYGLEIEGQAVDNGSLSVKLTAIFTHLFGINFRDTTEKSNTQSITKVVASDWDKTSKAEDHTTKYTVNDNSLVDTSTKDGVTTTDYDFSSRKETAKGHAKTEQTSNVHVYSMERDENSTKTTDATTKYGNGSPDKTDTDYDRSESSTHFHVGEFIDDLSISSNSEDTTFSYHELQDVKTSYVREAKSAPLEEAQEGVRVTTYQKIARNTHTHGEDDGSGKTNLKESSVTHNGQVSSSRTYHHEDTDKYSGFYKNDGTEDATYKTIIMAQNGALSCKSDIDGKRHSEVHEKTTISDGEKKTVEDTTETHKVDGTWENKTTVVDSDKSTVVTHKNIITKITETGKTRYGNEYITHDNTDNTDDSKDVTDHKTTTVTNRSLAGTTTKTVTEKTDDNGTYSWNHKNHKDSRVDHATEDRWTTTADDVTDAVTSASYTDKINTTTTYGSGVQVTDKTGTHARSGSEFGKASEVNKISNYEREITEDTTTTDESSGTKTSTSNYDLTVEKTTKYEGPVKTTYSGGGAGHANSTEEYVATKSHAEKTYSVQSGINSVTMTIYTEGDSSTETITKNANKTLGVTVNADGTQEIESQYTGGSNTISLTESTYHDTYTVYTYDSDSDATSIGITYLYAYIDWFHGPMTDIRYESIPCYNVKRTVHTYVENSDINTKTEVLNGVGEVISTEIAYDKIYINETHTAVVGDFYFDYGYPIDPEFVGGKTVYYVEYKEDICNKDINHQNQDGSGYEKDIYKYDYDGVYTGSHLWLYYGGDVGGYDWKNHKYISVSNIETYPWTTAGQDIAPAINRSTTQDYESTYNYHGVTDEPDAHAIYYKFYTDNADEGSPQYTHHYEWIETVNGEITGSDFPSDYTVANNPRAHGSTFDDLNTWLVSPHLSPSYDTVTAELVIDEAPSFFESIWEATTIAIDVGAGFIDGVLQTVNPLQSWAPIPSIGPIFGHDLAYGAGYVGGFVAGIGIDLWIGNAMGAECATASLLMKGAKNFGKAGAAIDGLHALGNIISTGGGTGEDWLHLGMDTLALLGAKACFQAGTQVVVGTNPDGTYITRNIEDIQVGDYVLCRNQNDPEAPARPEEVTTVFQREVTSLRIISYQDASGNVETINTTDEHPFYVSNRGWVEAGDLRTGDVVTTPTGGTAVVVGSLVELLDEPIFVYNIEVASGHTYFVEDGNGLQTPVWVHNKCDVVGNPHGVPAHKATMLAEAAKYADRKSVVGVFLNKSLRTSTGVNSLLRPDLVVKYKNGTVKLIEVVSHASQTTKDMKDKVKYMRSLLDMSGICNLGEVIL